MRIGVIRSTKYTNNKTDALPGGVFQLELFLPDDYPMCAPKIRFLTRIYHPNIDRLGRICLDVLKNNWSPALQIRTILLSIQALLGAPNPEDPLNEAVAKQWKVRYRIGIPSPTRSAVNRWRRRTQHSPSRRRGSGRSSTHRQRHRMLEPAMLLSTWTAAMKSLRSLPRGTSATSISRSDEMNLLTRHEMSNDCHVFGRDRWLQNA